MSETKKLTRKEKIAQGLPKAPKRKTTYANQLAEARSNETKAILRNCGIAPRKLRLVADLVRGMQVSQALGTLKFTSKAGALPIKKLILSAISNWELKNEGSSLDGDSLIIKEIYVDGSRTLKRYQPAPQGRAHRIRKRTSHATVILDTIETLN